jgi:hypothetical protein
MAVRRASDVALAVECARMALAPATSATATGHLDTSSNHLADTVIRHRLSRLVINAGDRGVLDATDKDRVAADALAHTHAAFQLVGMTTRVITMLTTAGIRHLVLKGVALGALSQTAAGRGAGDVDILVDPRDVPLVHRVLHENGIRPALAQPDVSSPRSWRIWRYLEREATYVGQSTTVDLHWRISSQHSLFPSWDALYSRRTIVEVADTDIPTLSLADSLAAACYHAYFDQFQPVRSLVDVVMLIRLVDPDTLPDDLPRRLRALMAGVVSLVGDIFPEVVDDEVSRLLAVLPPAPRIVRQRFDNALAVARLRWDEKQDGGALLAKLLAEARFDSPLHILPRFIGKRLLDFPAWTAEQPTTSIPSAIARRLAVEGARHRKPSASSRAQRASSI